MITISAYHAAAACTWCGHQEECLTLSIEDSAFLNRSVCMACFRNLVQALLAQSAGTTPDARPGKRTRRARTAPDSGRDEAPADAAPASFFDDAAPAASPPSIGEPATTSELVRAPVNET